MTIVELTTFLGWTTIINFAILIISTIILLMCKKCAASIHTKMFNLKEEDVLTAYFDYLARYKILVLVFNLAPYIALRIMG